jgi:hypothetical protein
MTSGFLSLRYRHTDKKNVGNKKNSLQEKLEHSVDIWATKFM